MFQVNVTWLYSVLEASLGCMRSCLKNKQAKRYPGARDQGFFPLP